MFFLTNSIYALVSVGAISLISLAGIFTIGINKKKLEKSLIFIVSFAVGALFGDAFLHLIPEAYNQLGNTAGTSLLILGGILTFFVLEKIIHWRHCHKGGCPEHFRSFTIMNLVGDGVHNFIDGMLIGSAYLVSIPIGLSTTLAVLAHEIPQEIGDFGVLVHGGYRIKKALILNLLSALLAFVGVGIALILGSRIEAFSLLLLPFTAGGFIYIAGSDLIPELHQTIKVKKAFGQLLAIFIGTALMYLLTGLE